MTARSMHRGWPMEYVGDTWVYSDTKLPVAADPMRKCGHCFLPERPDGHDPCLGKLPGAKNACCGHGDPRAAYVQFLDGRVLSGQEAFQAIHKQQESQSPDALRRVLLTLFVVIILGTLAAMREWYWLLFTAVGYPVSWLLRKLAERLID